MSQITLETDNALDLKLLLLFANRLKVNIVSIETDTQELIISDDAISSVELYELLENSASLDFLKEEAEDIYSDKDLKTVY